MSDHWKALADLLGTPPLDRGSFEAVPEKAVEKPSEKIVSGSSSGGGKPGQVEKVGSDKAIVDKPNLDKPIAGKPSLSN